MKKGLLKSIFALLFLLPVCAGATVNSNSITEDGIEYYVQTDKPVYGLGEDIEMLFRITNLRDEDITIPCSRRPEFNFYVQEDGETIWMQIHGWYGITPGIDLSVGESVQLLHVWDMIDDMDILVEPGVYNVVGIMYNQPWNYNNYGNPFATEVAVPITIVPEPSSLALLLAGMIYFTRKRSD
jgi:hypothetical protein